MVQAPSFADAIRVLIIHSEAGELEARKNQHYSPEKDPVAFIDRSTAEKLYNHGIYLLNQFNILLDVTEIPDYSNSRGMLNRARYSLYRELCYYGLKNFADEMRSRRNSSK